MKRSDIVEALIAELLDRSLCPSEVAEKLQARGYTVSPSEVACIGILRKARPEVIILDDVGASKGIGRLPPADMVASVEGVWRKMPSRAQTVAGDLINSIVVTRPDDVRLRPFSKASKPRAALLGTSLLLPCDSDPEEIWHEVGHAIVADGLTPDEEEAVYRTYDFSGEQRTPPEVLAEDFYFMVKGDKASPFWEWWFVEGDLHGMATAISKIASDLQPLDVVEAALDAFADLVYESGDEKYVWFYGIAKEALRSARKEDRLAYEDRGGVHQYYYYEDVAKEQDLSRKSPMNQPLRVERPDVTIRGVEPTAPGPGIM